MAKFEIPRFRYLFQDEDGDVWHCISKPCAENCGDFLGGGLYKLADSGTQNPNWRNTLIDLETNDYEFKDGILRRVENDTTKN